MERLTDKYGTTSCNNVGSVLKNGTNDKFIVGGKAIIKLKELEDLMELYHCNDIVELKKKLKNWEKVKELIKGLYAKSEYGGIEHCVTSYILREMSKLEKGEK